MMMNLFSPFDPCTGVLSLNWFSSILMFIMMNLNFWTIKNNLMNLFTLIIMGLHLELKLILPIKGFTVFPISLMLLILFNNLLGLLPYVFTSPSHLIFSLGLSLPLWMALMIFGWKNKMNHMMTHLVPMGTPAVLMPIMVIIETISNLIRPGSLAVRLSANMIAGHLLMSLLGSSMDPLFTVIFMFIFMLLMVFEASVSVIQSYVFMTLLTLYSSEV